MGVAAEDHVDARDPGGHLEVHVHAVVGDHHHQVRLLVLANAVDHLLHVLILDAEGPVRDEALRVGDGGVGEGLADDGHLDPADLLDGIGLEGQAVILAEPTEVGELVVEQGLLADLDVLGHEIALEGLDVLDDLGVEVGELPVTGHHIHAQQVAGADHVHAAGPIGGAGALPGVAAVQQQAVAVAALGAHALDQGLEMGEAADHAELVGRLVEVQIGEGVGLDAAGGDAEVLEEAFAHDMRGLTERLAQADVHVGLAEIDGVELGVGVGDVQQGHVAELGHLIEVRGLAGGGKDRRGQHTGSAGEAHELDKFAAGDGHGGRKPLSLLVVGCGQVQRRGWAPECGEYADLTGPWLSLETGSGIGVFPGSGSLFAHSIQASLRLCQYRPPAPRP